MLLAERLVREIVDRRLEPGTMLPPERDMLARYEVGRGTLREALRYLELQGVLTIKPGPGGGPMVTSPDARHLASTLALLLELDATPFREIVEARLVLEPILARQAALRAREEQVHQIARSVESMGDGIGSVQTFITENRRFHELVAWASANHVFGHLLSSLRWITDGTALGIDYAEKRQRAVHRAHDRIYRAIRNGLADEAEDAMRSHLQEFATFVERRYPELTERPIFWSQYT